MSALHMRNLRCVAGLRRAKYVATAGAPEKRGVATRHLVCSELNPETTYRASLRIHLFTRVLCAAMSNSCANRRPGCLGCLPATTDAARPCRAQQSQAYVSCPSQHWKSYHSRNAGFAEPCGQRMHMAANGSRGSWYLQVVWRAEASQEYISGTLKRPERHVSSRQRAHRRSPSTALMFGLYSISFLSSVLTALATETMPSIADTGSIEGLYPGQARTGVLPLERGKPGALLTAGHCRSLLHRGVYRLWHVLVIAACDYLEEVEPTLQAGVA